MYVVRIERREFGACELPEEFRGRFDFSSSANACVSTIGSCRSRQSLTEGPTEHLLFGFNNKNFFILTSVKNLAVLVVFCLVCKNLA